VRSSRARYAKNKARILPPRLSPLLSFFGPSALLATLLLPLLLPRPKLVFRRFGRCGIIDRDSSESGSRYAITREHYRRKSPRLPAIPPSKTSANRVAMRVCIERGTIPLKKWRRRSARDGKRAKGAREMAINRARSANEIIDAIAVTARVTGWHAVNITLRIPRARYRR